MMYFEEDNGLGSKEGRGRGSGLKSLGGIEQEVEAWVCTWVGVR